MRRLLAFLIIGSSLSVQSQPSDLESIITEVRANVFEVKTGDDTYKQKIESLQACVINYSYDEIDKKGEVTNKAFEFNLADIDIYTVREETKGDVIKVFFTIKNKQKLIKVYQNGEVGDYKNELSLYALNVDNARALVDFIKKAIPLAEEITKNKLKLNSYEEMETWLSSNIKEVRIGEKTYKQEVSKGEYPGSIKFTQTSIDAKSSTEEQFQFNLSDLNLNSMRFAISGNKVGVEIEIKRKQDLIEYKKNTEVKPFKNKLKIVANNIEEARNIKTVLGLIVPNAEKIVEESMPNISTQGEALEEVSQYIKSISYGETKIDQNFMAGCICKISVTEQNAKKTVSNDYSFNLIDINLNILDYDVSGEKMFLELPTNNENKLIKVMEDKVLDGYDNSLKLYVKDIEIARRLKYSLKKAAEYCIESYAKPFGTETNEILSWMMIHVKEVNLEGTAYKQVLESLEKESPNKIKYSKTTATEKKGVEEVFEFNLSDINPRGVNYEIRGKRLSVRFETNFKDKIIKYYKNGEIQKYTNRIEIEFDEIEAARNFIAGMNQVIENLTKK